MHEHRRQSIAAMIACAVILHTAVTVTPAHAGHKSRRARSQEVVVVHRPIDPVAYAPRPLGTFQPTPYLLIRGNEPVGAGGYSPLGMYGDSAMVQYGPFSPLRAASAPVESYSRGYDGQLWLTDATTTSYPNLPVLAPVVYPTQANNYWGPRTQLLPAGANAINWRDQN